MAAYLIAQLDVTDPETFEKYRAEVPGTIAKYGGKYLVRGGEVTSVEGGWAPKRLVLLEFPNMTTLKKWYESDDYQSIIALRTDAADCQVIFVEGV